MLKKIERVRILLLAILIIEILIFMAIYAFFPTTQALTLLAYAFLKNVVLVVTALYVFSVIENNNISVQEALNKDAKNAFLFGGVGLLRYDESRNISWTSDLFQEIKEEVIGKKLLEWQPQLASLFEEDDVKQIEIQNRKYEVYNSIQSRLLYLKDVTDYVTIYQDYIDQQVSVAYITIDNYDESIEKVDEQTAASIQTVARQTILDWAKNNGIVLKRYKSDGFIAVFNERIYQKQAEQRFSILDEFKNQMNQFDVVLSLSIGIGRGSNILRELDELAFKALGLADSRGGDQVAVQVIDEDTRYFGGTTESVETSNRIRSRVISHSMQSILKQAGNILIMGHSQSDFDSFGSSLAMYKIAMSLGKKVNIVLDINSIEDKTKEVALDLRSSEYYKEVFVHPEKGRDLIQDDTVLVVVDTHKPSLVIDRSILTMCNSVIVIDHHRRGTEFIDLPVLTYLEAGASSTIELIIELLQYVKTEVQITEREATIMYTGLVIDTGNFRSRVGSRTFEVAARLREMQADVTAANRYLEDDFTTTVDKLSITQSAYKYGDNILIAHGDLEKIYSRTLLAKAGNDLISVSKVKAAFVIGKVTKNQVAISARSTTDINVQVIMEKLGGGGHFTMAACQIEGVSIQEAINQLETAINEYLDERIKE